MVLVACPACGLSHQLPPIPAGSVAKCRRCRTALERRSRNSLHRTAAFALAALILYVPANLLPILKIDLYGATTVNTVWGGVQSLWQDGDFSVAAIVFIASILVPLLKMFGLLLLCLMSWTHSRRYPIFRTRVFQLIEMVGRWAMLDVFVLAVLVSLVKLHRLASIEPGAGALAFAGVVVASILASASYDPQLIWQKEQDRS